MTANGPPPRDPREALLDEYVAEREAQPEPTRKQWQAAVVKWRGRVNIESLLTYGAERGWLD
jgi:hypothetical protein